MRITYLDELMYFDNTFGFQTGMSQQFALGQFLRSEYGHILNTTYKNSEVNEHMY